MTTRKIALPLSFTRAAVAGIDDGDRSVEVRWTTGAGVKRYNRARGEWFTEVLSLAPGHVRLNRLNGGAPVLDSHGSESLENVVGVVVEGSARILSPSDGRARLRFSRRPSVEPIWQDVRDRIIRSVSVGYRVYKFTEERGKELVLRAVDWEPFELSLVSIPADAGAAVLRGAAAPQEFEALIVPAAPAMTAASEAQALMKELRAGTISDVGRGRLLALAQAGAL